MEQRRDFARNWLTSALAGAALAGAVGCNRNLVQSPVPSAMAGPLAAAPAEKPSLLASAFAGDPRVSPAVPPAPPPAPKKTGPLSPDTDVAFADTEADAIFLGERPAAERDRLADSARSRYQIALGKDPKHKGALLGLARLYGRIGDKERAAATLQTATAAHPTDHALWHAAAGTLAKMGDWQPAADACRRALALDSENRSYQKTFGYCLARLGRDQEALEAFVKVMPEAEARYFLGRTQLDLGKHADGKQQIELAARADPKHAASRDLLAHLNAPAAAPGGVATVGHAEPATP